MGISTSSTYLIAILILIAVAEVRSLDTITPSTPLNDGDKLVTSDGVYALGFFTPNGSTYRYLGLWYNQVTEQTILWVANRNNPVTGGAANLSLSSDGVLKISSTRSGKVVWTSGSPATLIAKPVAQLLISGNLVVQDEGNTSPSSYTWESFDYPTDTLIQGMKFGINRTTGRNWNLTAWRSPSDPASGQYVGLMVDRADLELYLYQNNRPKWRTGPWNGKLFSGVPHTRTYGDFVSFIFINNASEVSFSYQITTQPTIYARLVVNYTGVAQGALWSNGSGTWNIFWTVPSEKNCDAFATCGKFGICDPNKLPGCDCMQGFTLRSPQNWFLGGNSSNCTRKTPLHCNNTDSTDGFAVINNAKLPDMQTVLVNQDMITCRMTCLRNCNCTGYAVANFSSNVGCVMWTAEMMDVSISAEGGQDLYLRLAAADIAALDESKARNKKQQKVVITLSVLGAFALVFCLSFLQCIRRRAKRKQMQEKLLFTLNNDFVKKLGESKEGRPDITIFGFSEIAAATDNFSADNKLGEGGFGPVYKGVLRNGKEIAVKRLSTRSGQGLEEFANEILLIAKLQHRNLVRLLGCCIKEEEKILIYEYMPHKSLDIYLFGPCTGRQLDWKMRLFILESIAQGLLYLHKHSRLRVIHRDLKASNILLDEDMNPKISDFGMARIFSSEEIQANTHRVVGTYGYMAPEYASQGLFSIKSDVFSYGVLMLEILSGMRNTGFHQHGKSLTLQAYAWELWNEGRPLELVDTVIVESCSASDAEKYIHIGLLCVQESADDRPTMSDVIAMFGGNGATLPYPKQPAFFVPKPTTGAAFDSENPQICSNNGLTATTINGR